MAIDFPANPTGGQIFTDAASGASWGWDGEKWTKGYNEPPAGVTHPPAETIPVVPPINGNDNVNDVLVDFSADIAQLQTDNGQKVAKAGNTEGIMTGFLTLNADPVQPLHAVPKQYVDRLSLPPGGTVGQTLAIDSVGIPNWGNVVDAGNF